MSLAKSTREGLKVAECEHGMDDKNVPMRYIPEQDPVQDALEKTKKTMYFKLMLPNTGNKLKVAIWVSWTPEQFLVHVCTAMHISKQLGLETKEANAMIVLEAAYDRLDTAKAEYTKLVKDAKQKAKEVEERDANPAPKGKKKAKEPKEKADNSAPDVIANVAALNAAKKVHKYATKKVEEARLAVAMAGVKPFEFYANLLSDKAQQPW